MLPETGPALPVFIVILIPVMFALPPNGIIDRLNMVRLSRELTNGVERLIEETIVRFCGLLCAKPRVEISVSNRKIIHKCLIFFTKYSCAKAEYKD